MNNYSNPNQNRRYRQDNHNQFSNYNSENSTINREPYMNRNFSNNNNRYPYNAGNAGNNANGSATNQNRNTQLNRYPNINTQRRDIRTVLINDDNPRDWQHRNAVADSNPTSEN